MNIQEKAPYELLLREKVNNKFKDKLDREYFNLLQDIDLSDDRQVILKLCEHAGITTVINITGTDTDKEYEVGILWNQIPRIVGVKGTNKELQDRASDWKRMKWVEPSHLTTYKDFKGSECTFGTFKVLADNFKGQIQDKSIILKIEGIVELVTILKHNRYDVSILTQWTRILTLVSREFPRLAYETYMEINMREQQARIKQLEVPQVSKYKMECDARANITPGLFSVTPDRPENKGYLYAYASASDQVQFKIKLGRTSKPKERNVIQNNSHSENNPYLVCVPVFDAKLAEYFLHQILQQCRYLHHNREFYRLSKERAIDAVHQTKYLLDQGVKNIYEPAIMDAQVNYISGKMEVNLRSPTEKDLSPLEALKKEVVEMLESVNKYKLLSEDTFRELLTKHLKTAFEDALAQVKEEALFSYKQTNTGYKITKIN